MADRKIIISKDAKSYETVGFNTGQQFMDHERVETYGNELVNGQVEATDHLGNVKVYQDGCHIVRRDSGHLQVMDKAEYVKFSGRAGTENED